MGLYPAGVIAKLFSFSLERKRNKKFKAVRCGTVFRAEISSAELPFGTGVQIEEFQVEDSTLYYDTFSGGAVFFDTCILLAQSLFNRKIRRWSNLLI